MALQRQPIALPFVGGVETKQDSKAVPAVRLLDLQNGVFTRGTTIQKRNGYRALGAAIDGTGATYANAHALARRDDELVLFADQHSYSYRPSSDTWADAGAHSSVIASDRAIARTGSKQTVPDMAINQGVTMLAWEDSVGGVRWSIVETVSGREVVAPRLASATGQRPRCLAIGRVLHLLWAEPGGSILIIVYNPATPTAVPLSSILTNDLVPTSSANPTFRGAFDACTVWNSTFASGKGLVGPAAVIAWALDAGGYRVGYIHPSGVLGSPGNGLPSVATYGDVVVGPIAVAFDNGAMVGVGVVWNGQAFGAPCIKHRVVTINDLTVAVQAGTLEVDVGTWPRVTLEFQSNAPDGTTTLWWAGEFAGASSDLNELHSGQVTVPGAVATSNPIIKGHGLVSRAFVDAFDPAVQRPSGDVYVVVAHAVLFFSYYAVIRISAGLGSNAPVVGLLQPVEAVGLSSRGHLASVTPYGTADAAGLLPAAFTSRQHITTVGYRIQLDSANGDQFGEQGIRQTTLDFNSNAAYQSAQLGRGLYAAGAVMRHYDGHRWAEAGFFAAPDTATGAIAAPAQSGGGALTNPGAYLYRFWYEEIDGSGELHRGPVSAGTLVTLTAANNRLTFQIPTCRLTGRANVRICIARSLEGGDGTNMYRCSSLDSTTVGDNGYIKNDTTVDVLSFTDAMSDAVLATKEPLYTNGGILSNIPSPIAGNVIVNGKSRLFWTDPSDPNLVRYSQQIADDTALELSAALSVQVDPYGGAIVGLAVMDDAVIVFKQTAIYVFGGPGPLANPFADPSAAFSQPAQVTSDVGAVSMASIAYTPLGIIFQSSKGFYLLGRDRQVVDIGAPVYAYKDETITRATLLPDRSQILLLAASGRTLLFDYAAQQWSTFTNHEGLDGLVLGGIFNYLRADGRVFQETPGTYKDDNAHIKMRIETAWIKLTGYLQGWQRILWAQFLGTYKSSHTLMVSYRLDYEQGWSAPFPLTVDTDYTPDLYGALGYGSGPYGGGSGSTVYQRSIHLNKRCEAIRFAIEDSEPTSTFGAAFELTEMLLIGGVIGDKFKLPAVRSN